MASKYWFAKHPDGQLLQGSATWDAGSIADGDEVAVDITVEGAKLGDFVLASLEIDVADLQLTANVTATDTVTLVLSNTGSHTDGTSAVNLDSTTANVLVIPKATYAS